MCFARALETFKELTRKYNESYLQLAKNTEPIIEKAYHIVEPSLMVRAGRTIGAPKDRGGAYEWAFMMLLGAVPDELEGRLDINQEDIGLEILAELQKDTDLMNEVKSFKKLCSRLKNALADLKGELNKMMKNS